MKSLTLTIKDLDRLNAIQVKLAKNQTLTEEDRDYISEFLSQLPKAKALLAERIPIYENVGFTLWDMDNFDQSIKSWESLFDNIPGYDYVGSLRTLETLRLLELGVVLIVTFAPSYTYNMANNDGPEIWLKEDGSAVFRFPTLHDAEKYPELYNFVGTWKEAYLLLIETLKKGWPMEAFPDELKPLLKK